MQGRSSQGWSSQTRSSQVRIHNSGQGRSSQVRPGHFSLGQVMISDLTSWLIKSSQDTYGHWSGHGQVRTGWIILTKQNLTDWKFTLNFQDKYSPNIFSTKFIVGQGIFLWQPKTTKIIWRHNGLNRNNLKRCVHSIPIKWRKKFISSLLHAFYEISYHSEYLLTVSRCLLQNYCGVEDLLLKQNTLT